MPRRTDHYKETAEAVRDTLARLLEKHGITAAELARRTNGAVSSPDITRILKGNTGDPGFSKIRAIADALGEEITVFVEGVAPATTSEIRESYAKFKDTLTEPLAPEIEAELLRAGGPFGQLPVEGWYSLLNVVRSRSQRKSIERGGAT